ncbi:hypothetical protein Oweho_3244 [Owenweeksia hongkongensis DSM 17368]|uniref:Helix-turn-helix domain-containing protein n=1 Tax=Owenweeksia hongkongensis (strain DSM 17368 / CIP 108786 / JCM 12287 / NRRL B-23963 / UST20020801) TaxID=926562 RepID=G8R495_OWEHD|nr:hypothetical protein [Owenweeksia hongkongensis]AEV34195.1 hypothetical protein Oweho_3244 [Owenweeksia hongkongensis DSM 17368]
MEKQKTIESWTSEEMLGILDMATDQVIDRITETKAQIEFKESKILLSMASKCVSDLSGLADKMQKRKNDLLSAHVTQQSFSQNSNDQEIFFTLTSTAIKLGCNRSTIYRKHIPNGLKLSYPKGPKGSPKVSKKDLDLYMGRIQQAA